MGKTALSLNMAQYAALKLKKTVAYFSIEMGKEALMTRILASEARISISDIRWEKFPMLLGRILFTRLLKWAKPRFLSTTLQALALLRFEPSSTS